MYSALYYHFLFPFYETFLRKRKTLAYLKELENMQWLSEEELKELQWMKLQKLLHHAYANVPYYKNIFNRIGLCPHDIKTLTDFRKIPFLTKDDIRNNLADLIAINYKDKKMFNKATGGSTGTPLQLKFDRYNKDWRQAAIKRVYKWAGYHDGKKTVYIWGAPLKPQPFFERIKHDVYERLIRHRLYNTFSSLSPDMMARCADEVNAYKPKHIIAYTSPLYNFARFIKETGRNIVPPSSIIVGAETLFPNQRAVIEEVFQCPVFETYGCREVASIAGECEKHNGMHINMENLYLEILKNGHPTTPHEVGEIVITDLTNYCMPFIRYINEDSGSFSETRCACGRGLSMLNNVEGRVLDTIRTKDGRVIYGGCFVYLLWEIEEIERFQVIQEDFEHIVIKIIRRKDIPLHKLQEALRLMRRVLGETVSIDVQFVAQLPLTPSGKLHVVTSKVPLNFTQN